MTLPQRVRDTCRLFQSNIVSISNDGVQKFIDELDLSRLDDFVMSDTGLSTNRFDKEINFNSVFEEAGFILIAHGIDFGSGFRHVLHEHRNGAGAWVTIRAGLVKMGLANKACEAKWLAGLTIDEIKEMFDLRVSELDPLAEFLQKDMNELGVELLRSGYSTPGALVSDLVHHGAAHMVAKLVEMFPVTFNDQYELINVSTSASTNTSQYVCFYKKAQLVVSEIYMRFYQEDERFNFPDIDDLTAFVDNVVVAMMRQHGCIVVNDESLKEKLEANEYLEKGSEEEVCLRARALTATEMIVSGVNKKHMESGADGNVVNAQRLCNWLWGGLGKLPANRSYPRHLTPSTSFY